MAAQSKKNCNISNSSFLTATLSSGFMVVLLDDHGPHVGAPNKIIGLCSCKRSFNAERCVANFKHQLVLCEIGGPQIKPSLEHCLESAPSPAHHSQKSHVPAGPKFVGTGVPRGNPLYLRWYVLLFASTLNGCVADRIRFICFVIAAVKFIEPAGALTFKFSKFKIFPP